MRAEEIMARPGVRRGRRGRKAKGAGIEAESSVGRMRKVYRGRDIEVSFDLNVCIHVGECLRGERSVLKLGRRPWVLPDEGPVDVIAWVVELCPSGALQYRRLDGGVEEALTESTTLTPIKNGPLLARGRIEGTRGGGTGEAR